MNLFIPAIVIVIVVASIINVARQQGEMPKPTIWTKVLKAVGLYQEPQKPQTRTFEYVVTDRTIDLPPETQNQLENTPTRPVASPSPSATPLSDEPPPPPPILGLKSEIPPPPPPITSNVGNKTSPVSQNETVSQTLLNFLGKIADFITDK